MAITWQDDLATGIEVVDFQHKEIFARFDAFSDACDQGLARDALLNLLRFLNTYTEQHFWDEEDYMAGSMYPHLATQKKAHRSFLDDLTRLEDDVKRGDADPKHILAVRRLLVQWLIKHIRHMDKEFARFLTS